jgi:subtilisin
MVLLKEMRWMRKIVYGNLGKMTALLIVLMMLLGSSMSLGLGTSEKVDVLIGFHNMSERAQNRAMVRAFGGEIYAEFNLVDVIAARMTPQQAAALSKNPKVDYIEPDAEVFALAQETPWGIDRVFGAEDYSFPTWSTSKGAGIGVAVLDTGIDIDHVDLDVKGGIRFYLRGLTLKSDNQYDDGNGHGTHVAGTIAALDNEYGVVGVAPAVNLYAVKVLGDNGSGSVSAIVAGIEWVCKQSNISIINMSLGSSSYSSTFENACNTAYDKGILIVASAGNSGNDAGTGDTVGYPAKYGSVIAVAASDINDDRAYFSSTGPDVDLIAPGVNILSTVPDSLYEDGWSGTSMASPHVAGAAALVWAADPTMSNTKVWQILTDTAENLGLPFYHQGNGLVRADLAVDAVNAPVTQYTLTVGVVGEGTTTPAAGSYIYDSGSSVELSATAADGYLFEKWVIDSVEYNTNPMSVTMNSDITATAYFIVDSSTPTTYTITAIAGSNGTIDPSGTVSVNEGAAQSFAITPDSGYQVADVIVDNQSVGAVNSYEFSNITANHKIEATFNVVDPVNALSVSIISPKSGSTYKWNDLFVITAKVLNQNSESVNGASVTIEIFNLDGTLNKRYTGITSAIGEYSVTHKVANKALPGMYTIKATASLGDLTSVSPDPQVTFNVIKR